MTGFETELTARLRATVLGTKEQAADALYEELRRRGVEKPPTRGSLRTWIYRLESGATKMPRSDVLPVYLEMLGIETQRPAVEAVAAAVEDRLNRIEAMLARVLAIVEAHDAAFTEDGRWLAVLAPGQTVQVDEVQLRSAADESVRRLYAEGEAEAREDAL